MITWEPVSFSKRLCSKEWRYTLQLKGCESWAIREEDKSRITSAEMEFMGRTAKYMRQDYKTDEEILSELKINPLVKKIQNYVHKCVKHVRRMDRDGQTAILNYAVSTVWETKPRTNPQNNSRVLMGLEEVTRSNTLQAIWWMNSEFHVKHVCKTHRPQIRSRFDICDDSPSSFLELILLHNKSCEVKYREYFTSLRFPTLKNLPKKKGEGIWLTLLTKMSDMDFEFGERPHLKGIKKFSFVPP